MNWWPFSRNLSDRIGRAKDIKVCGVKFTIKKIDVLDHMTGAKVLQQVYELYQTKDEKTRTQAQVNPDKIKAHYIDVFCAAIVNPRVSRKQDDAGAVFVENLMTDWELVDGLYTAIVEYTYGKKNLRRTGFLANA